MFVFGTQMSVFAAPAIMPDGNLFNAEYYAKNNPDVVAFFGNDPAMLYRHYVQGSGAFLLLA